MEIEITDRDKRLLALLGAVLMGCFLLFAVMMPLYRLNHSMYMQRKENDGQIEQMEQQRRELKGLQADKIILEAQVRHEAIDTFSMMENYQIEKLLTGMVTDCNLKSLELQIQMPEEPADIAGFGEPEENGSNPDGRDGVYLAKVRLKVSGEEDGIDRLLDILTAKTPQVRLIRLDNQRTETELTIADVQIEVAMSRKE